MPPSTLQESAAVTGSPSTEPPRPRPRPGAKQARYRRWLRLSRWLIVLALVAFALAVVSFVNTQSRDERVEGTLDVMREIAAELELHFDAEGALPQRMSDVLGPTARVYRGDIFPKDAYGARIEYRVLNGKTGAFVLRSLGADGKPDTADDLLWPEGLSWID